MGYEMDVLLAHNAELVDEVASLKRQVAVLEDDVVGLLGELDRRG